MAVKKASVSSGSSAATPKTPASFVWTPELESELFSLLLRFKPAGVAAHIHVAIVFEHLRKQAPEVGPEDIWEHIHELYDVEAANEIETGPPNPQRRKKPQGDASDSGEDDDEEDQDDDDDAQDSEQDDNNMWNRKRFKFVEFSLPKKEFTSVINEMRKTGKLSSESETAASKEPKKSSSSATTSSKETETPKSAGSKKRPTRSTPSSTSSSASKKKK